MEFTIPFLGTKIALGFQPGSAGRGFIQGKFSADPQRDLKGYKADAGSLFTAWRNQADIYSCVREITDAAGIGGMFFYDPRDEKQEAAPPNVAKKKLMDALSHQYGSFDIFKTNAFQQHLIAGNCYIEKVRNARQEVIGLKTLDARTMSIVTDEFGNVYAYIQRLPMIGEKILDSVVFKSEDVIHWKLGKDPNNEAFGFSPIEPILWEARTDLSAMVSNYFFFENDAVPAVQYILEPNLSEVEAKRIMEDIKKQFRGSKNRHKGGVLQGVKEIKTIRTSQKDMEYLEGRKYSTEKICAAFGVPKVMLGYTEGVNFTNHEGQQKKFYEGTVRSYERSFERIVNGEIIPSLGIEKEIAFGFNPASLDTEEMLWNRAMLARDAGLLTINGARSLVGLDPIDPAKHGDMGDVVVLGSGANAVLLTDLGIDPVEEDGGMKSLRERIEAFEERNLPEHV